MSMRARKLDDYDDKRGIQQGDHKDTMNAMFDNKAEKQESANTKFIKTLDESKAAYDRQLYGDWVVKVYDRCASICLAQKMRGGRIKPG